MTVHSKRKFYGFTLAEVLIAMSVLGIIATFTVPKILTSAANKQYSAVGKEAASILAQAYENYKINNQPNASTTMEDLAPFINYVRRDTTTVIDNVTGQGAWPCDSFSPCLVLANGAYIHYVASFSFTNTTAANALFIHVDPDGKYSGNTSGPAKSLSLFLYYTGDIKEIANLKTNTTGGFGVYNSFPLQTPDWFSWN